MPGAEVRVRAILLAERIGQRAIAGFLRKPWTYEELVAAIDAATGLQKR